MAPSRTRAASIPLTPLKTSKRCPMCGKRLPVELFSRRPNGKFRGYCDSCFAAKQRVYHILRYGISWEDYLELTKSGRCAICHRKPKRLALDHDHKTGEVRGALCYPCNILLHWLEDKPDVVRSAIRYLKAHRAV